MCVQVDVATKLRLIEGLVTAGIKQIEVTSFVSPKWVPQLADAAEVYRKIAKQADVKYPVLVPNMKVSHGQHTSTDGKWQQLCRTDICGL